MVEERRLSKIFVLLEKKKKEMMSLLFVFYGTCSEFSNLCLQTNLSIKKKKETLDISPRACISEHILHFQWNACFIADIGLLLTLIELGVCSFIDQQADKQRIQ